MHPSRRTALKTIGATTALAATGLLPSIIFAAPSASANDKLRVGLIGAGNRAKWLTRALCRESHRAELVAVATVTSRR
jgi:ornithine cyclodeaminase/alanine dehydrogenase-like protein (mu-crystallin family)